MGARHGQHALPEQRVAHRPRHQTEAAPPIGFGRTQRILPLTPSEPQMDVMLMNRFTVANLGWSRAGSTPTSRPCALSIKIRQDD